MKQICRTCNKEFTAPHGRVKFCSEECLRIFHRLKRRFLRKFHEVGVSLVKLGQDYPFSKPEVVYETFSADVYGEEYDEHNAISEKQSSNSVHKVVEGKEEE